MVGHLVDSRDSQTILDACAAPGGKTMLLARTAGPRGRVVAGDIHEHRLRILQQQLNRTGITNVWPVGLDATRAFPFSAGFDRVLIDAPCSGTGTLSRNPEIRWRGKGEDFGAAPRCQSTIVRDAPEGANEAGPAGYSNGLLAPGENEH